MSGEDGWFSRLRGHLLEGFTSLVVVRAVLNVVNDDRIRGAFRYTPPEMPWAEIPVTAGRFLWGLAVAGVRAFSPVWPDGNGEYRLEWFPMVLGALILSGLLSRRPLETARGIACREVGMICAKLSAIYAAPAFLIYFFMKVFGGILIFVGLFGTVFAGGEWFLTAVKVGVVYLVLFVAFAIPATLFRWVQEAMDPESCGPDDDASDTPVFMVPLFRFVVSAIVFVVESMVVFMLIYGVVSLFADEDTAQNVLDQCGAWIRSQTRPR